MKHKSWLQCLIGALFAFMFSAAAVGMLVTGWDLPAVCFGRLIFWCGLFSVLSAVLFYFRYGWCMILLLSVFGAFVIWQDGALWEQMQSFAYMVSSHFHNVYNWPVIGSQITPEYHLVLILSAYLTALAVSFCICCRKNSITALPAVILPLVLCLITTDTLPDELYLFLIILGIVMFLVTDWVRRKNPRQFASHTLRILVPSAAALALLFMLNPQENYVNHAAELQAEAENWFHNIQSAAENAVSGNITGSFGFRKLNLRSVGPKSDFTYKVMEAASSQSGTLYLRGRDYDIYTGTEWESSGDRHEVIPAGEDITGTVTIVTNSARSILYTPYYPSETIAIKDGFAANTENLREYSFAAAKNPGRTVYDVEGYTELPPETYRWAKELADQITDVHDGKEDSWKVKDIRDYVRTHASYDLSTSAMSREYDDFAEWFLKESDTGYCVHFATAAAVLLRAAGIPARYVEGYTVSCQADEKTVVTNQNAHAWVEYYNSSDGVWQILEATPADAFEPDESAAEESDTAKTEDETEISELETDNPPKEDPEQTQEPVSDDSDGDNTGTEKREDPEKSGEILWNPFGNGENSGGAGNSPSAKEPFVIPEWADELAWILFALLMIPVQGKIRIKLKRRYRNRGTPNEMAIIRWKQSVRLAKLTGTELPGILETLALKAKFSQHTITAQELEAFELFRKQILQKISLMPWYRKVFLRWICAVG